MAGAMTWYYLQRTFADGTAHIRHRWAYSTFTAEMVSEQVLSDWQALRAGNVVAVAGGA